MTYDTRENGKIGILTLNNPDKMNALTEDMGDALKSAIDNISHAENHVDSSLRTVIITGAGLLLGFFHSGFLGDQKCAMLV